MSRLDVFTCSDRVVHETIDDFVNRQHADRVRWHGA